MEAVYEFREAYGLEKSAISEQLIEAGATQQASLHEGEDGGVPVHDRVSGALRSCSCWPPSQRVRHRRGAYHASIPAERSRRRILKRRRIGKRLMSLPE
jgi:hypothetical protein